MVISYFQNPFKLSTVFNVELENFEQTFYSGTADNVGIFLLTYYVPYFLMVHYINHLIDLSIL